jgi:ABC-type glycerol-3-phosphate transport system substrate-binding protein
VSYQTRKRTIRSSKVFILFLSIIFIGGSFPVAGIHKSQIAAAERNAETAKPLTSTSLQFQLEDYYYNVIQEWRKDGVPAGKEEFYIPAHTYTGRSEDAEIQIGAYQGKANSLIWKNQRGWVEYEIEVPKAGLYELELVYFPFPRSEGGSQRAVQFSMYINGEFQFREARAIDFYREFSDVWPLRTDSDGNDLRPQVKELEGWKTQPFRDSEGSYSLPLLWNFKQGKNTIRLSLLSEPLAIAGIRLTTPAGIPSYQEYSASTPAVENQGSHLITIEAERMDAKNETSLQVSYERDPLTTPVSYDQIRYNTTGGWTWDKRSQAAAWEFEVPETGYYKIALRANQGFRSNLITHRNIYINGEPLFEELSGYPIPYNNRWQGVTLSNDDGEPLEFYLEKGKNTITLEATHSPYMSIISEIDKLSGEFKSIALDIRAATSGREDSLRRWRIEEEMPGLTDRLKVLQQKMGDLASQMLEINGVRDDVARSFESSAKDIEVLLKDPNEIPNKALTVGSLQERIEAQRATLLSKPLQIDKIYIATMDRKLPAMRANFFQRAKGSVISFYYSFFDKDALSESRDDELNVWFMMGRDYVNELQALADEKFSPEHGNVKVRVNLIQQPELLIMANAAGIMPDVALGVPGDMPYDMALRGAAMDLSRLPGAQEVFKQYPPGALMPFHHDGGIYGIPETMQFKVMFYRTDILDQLGLEVPNTWDDVYDMLLTLVQNNYNFYMDPRDFSFLFYQNGVELYSKDGGSTGLDSPEAFETFKQWTNFFNIYGLERQVQSFYNQFRRGYLPIGIADFNQYMYLLVAAPELRGFWGIAPIPGTVGENGEIIRWSGGIPSISGSAGSSMTSVMLFENSNEKMKDLAWEFAKWYTSAEIQTEFGTNLEQYHGQEFRWNAANIEAFANMPWKEEELGVILEQLKWFKDFPNVPGSYMTGREINFAWIRTVIDGENYRTSLETAIRNINRELRRKQQEFGLLDQNGELKRPIPVLEVNEPWTGVDKYAR